MKKFLCVIVCAAMIACMSFPSLAVATYSDLWKQDSAGNWHIYDLDGKMIKNAWVCDDFVALNGKNIWYLIDPDGNMVVSGLVQDGTGNYYSLETNHNGYYGMLRYQSGNYDGIHLSLNPDHNGSFAAIQNQDAIDALAAKYGVTSIANIDNSNIYYTSINWERFHIDFNSAVPQW